MREPSCSGSLPHFDGDAAVSKGKRGEFIWDFGAGRDPDNVEGTAARLALLTSDDPSHREDRGEAAGGGRGGHGSVGANSRAEFNLLRAGKRQFHLGWLRARELQDVEPGVIVGEIHHALGIDKAVGGLNDLRPIGARVEHMLGSGGTKNPASRGWNGFSMSKTRTPAL